MTGRPAAAQYLRDLPRLRRVRDRIDREPTDQPYGVRDSAVRDPADDLIRIYELR